MKPKAIAERGSVFIIALMLIVVMIVVGAPIMFRLSAQYRTTDRSFKSLAAMNLAEAGVERAIWELNFGDISTWDGDDNLRTLTLSPAETATGEVIISVQNPESASPVVESTGRMPHIGGLTIDKTIRVILEGGEGMSLFDYGIFGNDGVELHGDAVIDSYDSTLGDYGEEVDGLPNVGAMGHAGTNAITDGSITLLGSSTIYGNAVSGPESDPETAISLGPNANLFGEKLAQTALKELVPVPPPEDLPYRGDLQLGNGEQSTISLNGMYGSFDLGNSARVTIASDVTLYITGDFVMKNGAQIEVAEGVSVTIYLGGSFEQKNSSAISNPSNDPTKIIIYGTESFTQMDWKSEADFYGAVYAPSAEVVYHSEADFYGSIVAGSIVLHSGAGIHYDESLMDLDTVLLEDAAFVVKSWQEKAPG